MVCCRAENETGRLSLKEEKENAELKITYLFPWPTCLSGLWVPREGCRRMSQVAGTAGEAWRNVRELPDP